MKSFILVILILFSKNLAFGHQDFYVTHKYGNVQTRIKTGFDYEQINIVKIIGKMSEKLCAELNYNKSIYLDFNHAYTGDIDPDYFISFGKGVIKYTWNNDKAPAVLNTKGIVLRQVSHEFDIESTLKLLQYSITNLTDIKNNQCEIVYEQNYCQWIITTIDTVEIKNALLHSTSPEIEEIICQRTYVNNTDWTFGVDYFYQDRKFNFLVKAYNDIKDTIALTTKSIFQIAPIDSGTKLIFDTDCTFHCVGWHGRDRVVSIRHAIKEVGDNYQPFDVNDIGDDLISIHFNRHLTEEELARNNKMYHYSKTSIYDQSRDILIDDLRERIKE